MHKNGLCFLCLFVASYILGQSQNRERIGLRKSNRAEWLNLRAIASGSDLVGPWLALRLALP
jgi:hypothetical protein